MLDRFCGLAICAESGSMPWRVQRVGDRAFTVRAVRGMSSAGSLAHGHVLLSASARIFACFFLVLHLVRFRTVPCVNVESTVRQVSPRLKIRPSPLIACPFSLLSLSPFRCRLSTAAPSRSSAASSGGSRLAPAFASRLDKIRSFHFNQPPLFYCLDY